MEVLADQFLTAAQFEKINLEQLDKKIVNSANIEQINKSDIFISKALFPDGLEIGCITPEKINQFKKLKNFFNPIIPYPQFYWFIDFNEYLLKEENIIDFEKTRRVTLLDGTNKYIPKNNEQNTIFSIYENKRINYSKFEKMRFNRFKSRIKSLFNLNINNDIHTKATIISSYSTVYFSLNKDNSLLFISIHDNGSHVKTKDAFNYYDKTGEIVYRTLSEVSNEKNGTLYESVITKNSHAVIRIDKNNKKNIFRYNLYDIKNDDNETLIVDYYDLSKGVYDKVKEQQTSIFTKTRVKYTKTKSGLEIHKDKFSRVTYLDTKIENYYSSEFKDVILGLGMCKSDRVEADQDEIERLDGDYKVYKNGKLTLEV